MATNVNKIVYGEEVLLDLTSDTVSAGSMLLGVTAHNNEGNVVEGTIATKTSANMTVSGKTVTAPAGYYATNQSKSVADGSYSASVTAHSVTAPVVTPSVSGTITSITSTSKPSGLSGVDFFTIAPAGSVKTNGVSSASGRATISTSGYITAGNITSGADTIGVSATIEEGTPLYLSKGIATATGSASSTISGTTFTYNSTNENYDITGSNSISGTASVDVTPGYVDAGVDGDVIGTARLASTAPKIAIKSTNSGTTTKTPVISKQTIAISGVTDASDGSASTTAPTSGVYVAVQSAKTTGTLTSTPSVTTAGYGTTTSGQYGATPATSTVGANASAMTYVPIKSANSVNDDISADFGINGTGTVKDYVDVSIDIPEGYQTAHTITKRFTDILPDVDTDIEAGYILAGYTGYDDKGNKVIGSMTNQGAKTATLNTTTKSYTIPEGYHNGSGTVSITTETKTATPTKSSQNITPSSGKVLSKVTVNAIPSQYVDTTDATAVAGDILKSKTAYVNGSKVTGTAEVTLVNGLLTIPSGFLTV